MLPNGRTGLDLRFWGEKLLWIGQRHDICAKSANSEKTMAIPNKVIPAYYYLKTRPQLNNL